MKIKARKSTAQLLGDYREALASHYRSIRAGNLRPKPGNSFPMNIQHLVEAIEKQELQRHESEVKKLEAQKALAR